MSAKYIFEFVKLVLHYEYFLFITFLIQTSRNFVSHRGEKADTITNIE